MTKRGPPRFFPPSGQKKKSEERERKREEGRTEGKKGGEEGISNEVNGRGRFGKRRGGGGGGSCCGRRKPLLSWRVGGEDIEKKKCVGKIVKNSQRKQF